jgi:hypothetical protein
MNCQYLRIMNMKKISLYIVLLALLSLQSCGLFELDNKDEPSATIQGEVVDSETGAPILTDQGSEGIMVRLTELSYGPNVQHNPDFFCKPDGTFQNTKLFGGTYLIVIHGPFIPLLREDDRGTPLADLTKTEEITDLTKVKFEVQPFLNVEWVGDPQIINGKVKAKVRVTRGVSEDDFRSQIEPMGGYNANFQNVTDVQLFVSYSSSVGYRARDTRWSGENKYEGAAFSGLLGQVIEIESKGTIPSGKSVFVRAAARINYDTPKGSGTKRYNYNEAKQLLVP